MKLFYSLLLAGVCQAQCTLTGVSITFGTPNVITYTGSSGAGCPGTGGGGPNDVTSFSSIAVGSIAIGDDGARGVKASAASIDAAGNASYPGSVTSGVSSGKTGTLEVTNPTAGHTFGISAPDSLVSDFLYLAPAAPSTNGFLQDVGVVPCPSNMPAGSPAVCRQLATATPSGGGTGGSGSFVLAEEHGAAGSTALNFTSCISSTYDEYEIDFNQLVPGTDAVKLGFQFSTDGGLTYDTTSGHYAWTAFAMVAGGTGPNGSGSDSAAYVTNNQSGGSGGASFSGRFTLHAPASSIRKNLEGVAVGWDSSTTRLINYMVGGSYIPAAAINAFRVIASNGVLASGDVRCYGIAK